MYGIGLQLTSTTTIGGSYSPASLFTANEVGYIYDYNDVANLDWRYNLLTYTEQFNHADWIKSGSLSVTADQTAAPSGLQTADQLVKTATAFANVGRTGFSAVVGQTYTLSAYFKSGTLTKASLTLISGTNDVRYWFDLASKTVGGTLSGFSTGFVGSSIQDVGNGWLLCSLTITAQTTQIDTYLYPDKLDLAVAGSVFAWGAQLELGSTRRAYQPITDVTTEVRARFPNATLYQDIAGTQPVTTAGQAVALRLDKSRGLALGPELFGGSYTTSVAGGTATATESPAGTLNITGDGVNQARGDFSFTSVVGRTYRLSVNVAGTTAAIVVGTTQGGNNIIAGNALAVGVNSLVFVATTTTTWVRYFKSGATLSSLSGTTVRELAGNHATQSDAAKRPLYSLLPANGVRNLANGSADVGDINDWQATSTTNGVTVTKVASGFDTDGLPYADYSVSGTATADTTSGAYVNSLSRIPATTGQTYTSSFISYVISGTVPPVDNGARADVIGETAPSTFIEATTSAVVAPAVPTVVTASRTLSNGATNQVRGAVSIITRNTATVSYTIRIKALQFELGSTRTAYQFNYAATNIVEPPFSQVGALLYDGVNDFMVTPAINFAGAEVLGTERVSNGTFTTDTTGWSPVFASLSVVSGAIRLLSTISGVSARIASQTITGLTVGRAYKLTGQAVSSGGLGIKTARVEIRTADGLTTIGFSNTINNPVSATDLQMVFTATETTHRVNVRFDGDAATDTTSYVDFDNVSLKEVITPADEIFLCHGVRKTSDAARAIVAELGDGGLAGGDWNLNAPIAASATYTFRSRGSVLASAVSAASFAAPETAVISCQGKISTDTAILRRNGVQIATSATDQGTGNYSNAPIYFGARAGTSLFFKGYEFSSICRSAFANPAQIASAEEWVRQRTAGAY